MDQLRQQMCYFLTVQHDRSPAENDLGTVGIEAAQKITLGDWKSVLYIAPCTYIKS